MKNHFAFLLFFAAMLLAQACNLGGGKTDLFLGEQNLPKGLKFSDPAEFTYEVSGEQAGPYHLEMELTYDAEALNGKEALPLYYQLVLPDSSESDDRFSLPLKENGNWKGSLSEDNVHRTLIYALKTDHELSPGEHKFRLFADTRINDPLKAVTKVVFRVRKPKEDSSN